jgi:hypothetical protein
MISWFHKILLANSQLVPLHIGDVFPRLHDAMPPGFCNVGVLLRWAAGLHEMETLAAATEANGGIAATEAAVRSWVGWALFTT